MPQNHSDLALNGRTLSARAQKKGDPRKPIGMQSISHIFTGGGREFARAARWKLNSNLTTTYEQSAGAPARYLVTVSIVGLGAIDK